MFAAAAQCWRTTLCFQDHQAASEPALASVAHRYNEATGKELRNCIQLLK